MTSNLQSYESRYKGSASPEEETHEYSAVEPLQIQVSSTFDADMILRKIIEDRSSILALRSEADRNERELLKAKVWQMQTSEQLLNAEKEISRHVAKARYDIAEYNESSKHYINGFIAAFQNGEIEKLNHHPFLPSLKDLEEAIARRKALVIEKVQADDRVRKLEIISSRHHVAKAVLKKNEEAFVRAIAIAKQQFSDSCGLWLQQFEQLVSSVPIEGISDKREKARLHCVSNTARHDASLNKHTTHENHHVKLQKCSSKRPTSEDQADMKYKRLKTDSGPVADLRHDHREPSPSTLPTSFSAGLRGEHEMSPNTSSPASPSVGITPPSNNDSELTQANTDFMNDMAIAEALTRLGG